MTPERWAQIAELLRQAMQLPSEKRAAFLNGACISDSSLRQEVESLLAASHEVRSSFLESPLAVGLAKGTRLGEYEVQSLLGAGGMGEVYRARDLRLRREVAIKVLPAFVSSDRERLRRFEQEAMAAAALNHANILAVYQMGTHEGAPYLVSELLEGETLREQIKRGALPLRKSIEFGNQIARGLAAAHDKGIVHRDLKPENLFVTKDARVKILDFGLAKLTHAQGCSADSALTLGSETEPGVVMGTAGYMAPEQVRGQPADHRADIFAFGAVLYEMLSGQRAFQKPTLVETMTAILNEEPAPIAHVVPQISLAVPRVIARCLEKNPGQRFQSASELVFALEALSDCGSLSAPSLELSHGARSKRKYVSFAGLGLIAVLLAGGLYRHLRPKPKLTEKDTIVLADFANSTGDPIFDDALNQVLSIQLGQSPFLKILSERRTNDTLKLMGHTPGEHITSEIANEICIRTGSKGVLRGSISPFGRKYLLGLSATACITGDKLTQVQGEAPDKEGVLETLSTMASDMRGRLGESIASVQKFDIRADATTSSLEALKTYAIGVTTLHAHGTNDAIPFFKRAVELDPQFAKAYGALAAMYSNLGETDLAAQYANIAYSLRDRVSEVERYGILVDYFSWVTGDLDKANAAYDMWIGVYPRDTVPVANRAINYRTLGHYQQALEGFQSSRNLDPDFVYIYRNIASAYLGLNRIEDAKSALDSMRQHGFQPEIAWDTFYQIAFLRNDPEEMNRQLNIGLGQPHSNADALLLEASTEAYHGRLRNAGDLARRAVSLQIDPGYREVAALNHATVALQLAACGNSTAAKQEARLALAGTPGRMAKARAALALAEISEIASSKALVAQLDRDYPFDTVLNRYWLPAAKSVIQIRQGNASGAIVTLERAEDYELGSTGRRQGSLYPAYIRGNAYLSLKNGPKAAVEFQKILDHPGIVLNDLVGALAHLQLGRAYTLSKERQKAKAAYHDFFTLWRDADPDVLVLNQAKDEYARLN